LLCKYERLPQWVNLIGYQSTLHVASHLLVAKEKLLVWMEQNTDQTGNGSWLEEMKTEIIDLFFCTGIEGRKEDDPFSQKILVAFSSSIWYNYMVHIISLYQDTQKGRDQ
jgi:hypothetical protein